MGNSNNREPVEPSAGVGRPGFISGQQSQQGLGAGGARQFDASGNQAISGAAAPLAAAPGGPTAQVTLAQAQEMALRITTFFESSKSMNFQALADDFDRQGMSFGLIQWNFGQNTLGPLLSKMLAADAAAFAGCFGPTTNFAALKSALDRGDSTAQLVWTRELQGRDKPAWRAAFQAVGSVDRFNAIQLAEAEAKFHPLTMQAVRQLRAIAPALMVALEFRSYAALFDLCVQQGGITKALEEIGTRVKNEKPATQSALLKIAVVERARLGNADFQSDCISRRMGILTGAPFESTEHGVTKKRANPQLALIAQFGAAQVAGV
ncbi:hypothetical protein Q4S45_13755 [Massilia sp. R2A-15]|uniref:hypothetical protein n=1 Tax=Massilia sp. R2A-15 TaxID=3064278 RepID=UPI0027342E98|nr:hypothetical protein [Massilia sp. R2A-15]WLI87801.1 hypothetical protein Q4S45_13755 [Massilia sp. R2A-15]